MRANKVNGKQTYGFSLIELIIVILLIGILSLTLTPRWLATPVNLNFEARRLLNDIRYTQALSMLTGQRYRWVKLSANAYQITDEAGSAILLPSGSTQFNFTSGVTFATITNLPNNLLVFASSGTPYIDVSIPGTPLSTTATIHVSASGQSRAVEITPETGYGALQ